MNVLLINLPWEKDGRLGVRAGSRWPFTSVKEEDGRIHYIPFPFFLGYATALLKKNTIKAKLFDAISEHISESDFFEHMKSYNPNILVFEISTPSFHSDMKYIKHFDRLFPDASIIICGAHASVFTLEILQKFEFVDYILLGEYEQTLLELVESLEKQKNIKNIFGLAARDGANIFINSRRATIDPLDQLPWPEREDVPIYQYNDGFAGLPTPNVQILASRGCPYSCIFCLWPQTIYQEHRYRKRNYKDVVDEIEYLIQKYNFNAFYFDDDVFNIEKSYVKQLCEEMIQRKIRVPWGAMARIDLMDQEVLDLMAKAGIYAIKYGIESASSEILSSCNKKIVLNDAHVLIKKTQATGIKVHLTFCLGLPGENYATVEETKKFIEDVQPDSFQISLATPFPGTNYYHFLKNKNWLLSENWSDYDGNAQCIVRTKDLTANELDRLKVDLESCFSK